MTSQPIHLLRQENLYKGHYQLPDEDNAQRSQFSQSNDLVVDNPA